MNVGDCLTVFMMEFGVVNIVRFIVNGRDYVAQTKIGVRAPRVECKITSKDGILSVEAIL